MGLTIERYGSYGLGWCVFPVVYNYRKFIVGIDPSFSPAFKNSSEHVCLCKIWEYREKRNFFFGHQGKRVFEASVGLLAVPEFSEDKYLDMTNLRDDIFMAYHPYIIKALFAEYEKCVVEETEKREALQRSLEWDGIVK